MSKLPDRILDEDNRAELNSAVDRISSAYATKLAVDLVEADARPFKRIVEEVRADHGECDRRLTIDWRLPLLCAALPGDELASDARFVARFVELRSSLVVPLLAVSKDDMMSDFSVRGADGQQLYVCGRDEGVRRTQLVLETLWQWVAGGPPDVGDDLRLLPALSTADAVARIPSIAHRMEGAGIDEATRDTVVALAGYVAGNHIIWLRLPCQPGDGTRLTVTYRTRFVADYSPGRGSLRGLYHRLLDRARKITGQEPYRFAVPVRMSSLCRSYHFQMSAPPGMYFVDQRFVLADNLHQSEPEQQKAFTANYGNAHVSGAADAGGPVAHLYARDLPPAGDNRLYAYVRVREKPPGSTAPVMWLALLTAGFLWFFHANWSALVAGDAQGVDLPSLAVALLGVASIWFSRAFREDVRTTIPLVSRLGLLLVGGSTLYSLVAILVQRVICTTSPDEAPVCPTVWTNMFSKWGFLVFAAIVSMIVVVLCFRRIGFHREYQKLRNNATSRHLRTSPTAAVRPDEPILTAPGVTSHDRLPNLVPRPSHTTLTAMIMRSVANAEPGQRCSTWPHESACQPTSGVPGEA